MFGNRGLGWKLAASLALIAGLGVLSAVGGSSINPALWKCAAQPERWHDSVVWISRATVVSAGDREFTIDAEGLRLPVRGESPAGPGLPVELRARFRAEGPHLVLIRGRALPPATRLRWLVEAVSVAVLAGVLWNLARHFSVRPRALQVEGA